MKNKKAFDDVLDGKDPKATDDDDDDEEEEHVIPPMEQGSSAAEGKGEPEIHVPSQQVEQTSTSTTDYPVAVATLVESNDAQYSYSCSHLTHPSAPPAEYDPNSYDTTDGAATLWVVPASVEPVAAPSSLSSQRKPNLSSVFANARKGKAMADAQQRQADNNKGKKNSSSSFAVTISRWNTFVDRIVQRHDDILREAQQGVTTLVNDISLPSGDPVPLLNALKAIEVRLIELRSKLWHTFSEKVVCPRNMMDDEGDEGWVDAAQDQLKVQCLNLQHDYTRFYHKSLGDCYRRMWSSVQASLEEPVVCTRCYSELDVGDDRLEPKSIQCRECHKKNYVGPTALVATYYAVAPDKLAAEKCLEKRLVIEQFELAQEVEGSSGDSRERSKLVLAQWESMEREYWESYVQQRSKFHPVGNETLTKHFVETRMRQWKQGKESYY